MKVRFKKSCGGLIGVFKKGATYDLPREQAEQFVKEQIAELVEGGALKKASPDTATESDKTEPKRRGRKPSK